MTTPEPPATPQPNSFTTPPPLPSSQQRTRPSTVTTAAALIFVSVALGIIQLIVMLASRSVIEDIVRHQPSSGMDPSTAVNIQLGIGGGCGLVVSILFAVLGVLVLRGNNAARITVWVLSGLSLLCLGIGAASNALNPSMQFAPGWYRAYSIVSLVLSLVLNVAIIVLLARRPSNDYFRKPVA
ncbi:MAG: hypothetical protein QOE03_2051 [Micromonosporaceae bacterium]|nr:hypothetical protein [Micromonosporaceae bacterium]